MGLSDRISRIIKANLKDMTGNFNQAESAVLIAGGTATGAVVYETVGGMGLAAAGTAVGITAPHLIAAGVVTGTAAYGAKKGIENKDPLALGATVMGAVGGAGVSATVGNMGLIAMGTGFSIGIAPVTAVGAVVGLSAYGLMKHLDEGKNNNDTEQVIECLNQIKLNIQQNIQATTTSKEQVQDNYSQAEKEVQIWYQIALLAMKKRREDLAREALNRKYSQQKTTDSLKKTLEHLMKVIHNLNNDLRIIERTIAQMKAETRSN